MNRIKNETIKNPVQNNEDNENIDDSLKIKIKLMNKSFNEEFSKDDNFADKNSTISTLNQKNSNNSDEKDMKLFQKYGNFMPFIQQSQSSEKSNNLQFLNDVQQKQNNHSFYNPNMNFMSYGMNNQRNFNQVYGIPTMTYIKVSQPMYQPMYFYRNNGGYMGNTANNTN